MVFAKLCHLSRTGGEKKTARARAIKPRGITGRLNSFFGVDSRYKPLSALLEDGRFPMPVGDMMGTRKNSDFEKEPYHNILNFLES